MILNQSRFLSSTAAVGSLLLLAACANSATVQATQRIEADTAAADAAFAQARTAGVDVQRGPVREAGGLNLAGAVTREQPGSGLPPELQSKTYTFVSNRPLTFAEVVDLITHVTHLSVLVRDGGAGAPGGPVPGSNASADLASARLATGGPQPAGFDAGDALARADAANGARPATYAPAVFSTAGTMAVNEQNVPLGTFLDQVADRFGYGWEYASGRIEFSRTQIATFEVPALQFAMSLGFALDSGASTGSSPGMQQTGGSSQTAQTKAAYAVWDEIEQTLRGIVGPAGTVVISGATGTVTVNAPAPVVRQVRSYLTTINREVSKQVNLSLTMYSVRLNKADNYKLDLNVVFSDGSFSGATATYAAKTAADMLTSVNDQGNGIGVAIIDPNSKWAGTSALVQALSTQGDVSVVRQTSLTTMNGIPVPFQLINTRGYVAEVSVTSAANSDGVTQTSLTPGSVTTGFNLNVVPRISSNGNVLLQYGINVSELVGSKDGFDEFSTGGQTVQLPNINARNFVQVSAVPSGGTLVLAGFEQNRSGVNASGAGDAKIPILGGARQAEAGREVVVIVISPRVISTNPQGG